MSSLIHRSAIFASAICKNIYTKNLRTTPKSNLFHTLSAKQASWIPTVSILLASLRSTHTPTKSFGIPPSVLKKKLKDSENLLLIDVRNPEEIQENGQIKGSINIPFESLKATFDLTNDAFHTKYGFDRRILNTTPLVFVCKMGIRSQKALIIAKEFGISEVFSLSGGFDAWKMEEA